MARRRLARRESQIAPAPQAFERVEFNRAAARALDILTAFTANDQFLGNAEIAHRTGIPRATVSRITATLTDLGYLNYADQIGKYEVGPRVLALSYSLMSRLRVHTAARPLMEELARDADAIVGLGMLDGLNVVFVELALGDRPYSQEPQVGFRVPVAFTSMGWSCLSAMNVANRTETLQRIDAAYPEKASQIRNNVQRALADIWHHGYCISRGALQPGSNAVGVPYLHPDGRHIMAFNMVAPNTVLTTKSIDARWGPRLVKLVQQLRASGTDGSVGTSRASRSRPGGPTGYHRAR